LDADGVDVDKLYEIVAKIKLENDWNVSADKPFWAMFYTIPNFHNPTGTLLPPSKCKSLVKAARDLDFLIACDDVYNLLYYTDEEHPPPRLFSYDDPKSDEYKGHVISNGSFSKILAPGFRVGWMEMSPRLVSRFKQS
jgi:DNA-binding transcriptional MocR family regulator